MKRFLDFSISLTALIFFSPVAILVALIIWVDLGLPIIFVQMRPGIKGKPLKLFKFRTMFESSLDGLLDDGDAQRLTRIGRFLRSTSLDEIPQLWNVIRGEMSLVGPRPLLMEYLPLYDDRQVRRHDVIPGITGWAQIHGRNNLSWQEKFDLDIWYVDNRTFFLDVKILFKTVVKVFWRDGISSKEHVTSERFEGNEK